MDGLIFKRTVSRSNFGYYHLSIPPEIGRYLVGPVGLAWDGQGLVVRPWPADGSLGVSPDNGMGC
ncbi:MAG: hypothetical protein A4E48_00786 [Methanosaeta sp. PtaU1.Bin060]|nr:MAG: hypothetical protein A4E48_00786 [Methanosaeta sp. PtaU1.Bin060]